MGYRKSILLRVRISFIMVFIFSVAIVYQIFRIQHVEGDEWRSMARTRGLQYRELNATRGNIYSDNGALLATSLPFYQLAFDPSVSKDELFAEKVDSLAANLSAFYRDRSQDGYKRLMKKARKNKRQYVLLNRRQINYQDKKLMETWPIFREGRMKGGVIFQKVDKRFRPFNDLGYRTIGGLSSENRGTSGLEYSFNRQLAGENGKALFEKMAGGGWKPVPDGSEVRPVDGYDVHTTLNINIQDVAESALLKTLVENNADYGSVVVMEVNTGKIKAISNLSRRSKGRYRESYNYAVGSQGSREPGSTFKLASMLALMEEANLELDDTVDTGNGRATFYNDVMRDHKPGGYGKLSVKEIFEVSSNIGVARLVVDQFGQNPERFIRHLERLQLHKPLGFQLIGEGKPYIKNPADSTWSGITLPWMSHGYELKMTPLQTLTLYNAVANNGRMVRPYIVKGISKTSKPVEKYETEVIVDKICSDRTLEKLKILLEGVVENGTARNISNSFYSIAGKTGTAKKVKDGRYTNQYYASFAGYFPADNPKYSCIVVIDNPRNSKIYGSDVAAPVFKEVADKIYSIDVRMQERYANRREQEGVFPVIRGGLQEDLALVCKELGIENLSDTDAEWVGTSIVDNSVAWKDRQIRPGAIPDVNGYTLKDALYILENMGLKVQANGFGRVKKQSLLPGRKFGKGETIKLELG